MKFYGPIGFSITEPLEDDPDVWKPRIVEKKYTGDILQYTRRKDAGEHIIDGLQINVQISILTLDPWFHNNITQIAYVTYLGIKWKVESIDPTKYPSVVLTLGGLYHGDEPDKSEVEETGTGSDSEEDSGDE